ncbi:mannose-1-phosphate guanylyltransferase [Amycolatopsis minnesotensis]|uniref:Mannose-1-phosphate guanylyltransferase n=1 Tax=Amycolatopsis minnesotensis TaxID=337894 RepID=A0ABP5B9M3_9PSEU
MTTTNAHVVVLAGGSGTRLWPASRQDRPKFLLDLGSGESLLESALRRALLLTTPDRVHVVTGASHEAHTRAIAEQLGIGSTIIEPSARDTAPALCLATTVIARSEPEALIISTPADHVIETDRNQWAATMSTMLEIALGGDIACVGISPTHPDTAYGYILALGSSHGPQRVASFKEKPDRATAERYLQVGGYLWNSAIMAWSAKSFLQHMETHASAVLSGVQTATMEPDHVDPGAWSRVPRVAIDYALLEPAAAAGSVVVVPGTFDWADIGTWNAWTDRSSAAARRNRNLVAVDAEGAVLYADPAVGGRRYAIFGLDDLVVVDTGDAVLITDRDHCADLKRLVARIGELGWVDLL